MSLSRIIKFTLFLCIISAYSKAGDSRLESRVPSQWGVQIDCYINPPPVFGPVLPPKMAAERELAAERAKKIADSSPLKPLGIRVFSTIVGPPTVEFK